MMYLLDTNVVSEMRKMRGTGSIQARIDRRVEAWVGSVSASDLYLSVVTILELETGVLLLERRDPAQGSVLRAWLQDRVIPGFSERILPVELAVAQRCASLHVPDPMEDRDSLIAATALVHGMTLVTRNASHFQRTGAKLLNPWEF